MNKKNSCLYERKNVKRKKKANKKKREIILKEKDGERKEGVTKNKRERKWKDRWEYKEKEEILNVKEG